MPDKGFTLIELLVVVAIVAVLAGLIGTSFIGGGQNQAMEGFAYRMAQRMELARDRALQRNREWGLYIDGSEGLEFNELTRHGNRTTSDRSTSAFAINVQMSAQVEEYQVKRPLMKTRYQKSFCFPAGR